MLHGHGDASHRSDLAEALGVRSDRSRALPFDPARRRARCSTPPGCPCADRRIRRCRPRVCDSPAWFRRTSASTSASRLRCRSSCTTSASTCSSTCVPFEEYQRRASTTGDFEAVVRRHDQRPDAWRGRTCSGARPKRPGRATTSSATRTRKPKRSSRRSARRRMKPPFASPLASCSRSFSTIRRPSSWPGTSAREPSVGDFQVVPTPGRDPLLDAVAVDADKPTESRIGAGEEDLDTLRAADGGGRGRAAARLRRGVDLSRCAAARSKQVIQGNLNVARRVAEQIELYVIEQHPDPQGRRRRPAADRPRSRGSRSGSSRTTSLRVSRVHGTDADSTRTATPIVTSRIGKPTVTVPGVGQSSRSTASLMSRVLDRRRPAADRRSWPFRSTDGSSGGWLVGRVSLEELWRMVDRIRVGRHGLRAVVTGEGQLLAHGEPESKSLVARGDDMLVASAARRSDAAPTGTTAEPHRPNMRLGADRSAIAEDPRRRRRDSVARLDGHRRAAEREAFADPDRAAAAARHRHRARAARDADRRLLLGPQLHQSDPRV